MNGEQALLERVVRLEEKLITMHVLLLEVSEREMKTQELLQQGRGMMRLMYVIMMIAGMFFGAVWIGKFKDALGWFGQ